MLIVEGVPGAGKSTLAKILQKEWGLKYFEEPVVSNPFLEPFYKDCKRFSLSSQLFFLKERVKQTKEALQNRSSVLDRSIYGDRIIAEVLYNTECMLLSEWLLYLELFDMLTKDIGVPSLIVFLDISVDKMLQRIKERGREFEQDVDLNYWFHLNNVYKDYFNKTYSYSPILRINADQLDFKHNKKDREYVLSLIEDQWKNRKYVS